MNYVRPNPFFTIIDLSSPAVSAFATIAGGEENARVSLFLFLIGRHRASKSN